MAAKKQILVISSYPPRQCGIATYSSDLIDAIQQKFSSTFSVAVCALESSAATHTYPPIVKYIWQVNAPNAGQKLANQINADTEIACVLLEHEFGLFAGDYGFDVLHLLYNLQKPIFANFHSVLPKPDAKRLALVKNMISASKKVFVMTHSSAAVLMADYGIKKADIVVIPHGTHKTGWQSRGELKSKLGFANNLVLSTFGLISSDKNLACGIEAIPEIKQAFPNVIYLIIGKTHPGIIAQEGETYRDSLEALVKNLGIEENVRFVNEYLDLKDLLLYLQATDVYLFTSKNPLQAVSGTFTYAMASGCPIISTPIPHAKELLDSGTGIIANFNDSHDFARAAIKLLSDEPLRLNMGINALQKVEATSWENVAVSHVSVINHTLFPKEELHYDLPEISLRHMYNMTTTTGIVQFSKLGTPDLNTGYTLDDNARALIALCKYAEITKDTSHNGLIDLYLSFMEKCQQQDGTFLNYVDQYGQFTQQNKIENLEDANGRAIWALGVLLSGRQKTSAKTLARGKLLFNRSFNRISELSSPRAISFAIKGLYHFNSNGFDKKQLIENLSEKLTTHYYNHTDAQWEWYEPYLTYANSIIPEAMLYAYLNSGNAVYKKIAQETFDFLISQLFKKNHIHVISNNGWKHKGKSANLFGEQPVDVAKTILTLQLFYNVFNDKKYAALMKTAFEWFLGKNHLNLCIYNAHTGGCYDGLEEYGVNLNQGAESMISYTMARLAMEELKKVETPNYNLEYRILPERTKTKKADERLFKKSGYLFSLDKLNRKFTSNP